MHSNYIGTTLGLFNILSLPFVSCIQIVFVIFFALFLVPQSVLYPKLIFGPNYISITALFTFGLKMMFLPSD